VADNKKNLLYYTMDDINITHKPLDVGAISASVTDCNTGATSLFVGTTRDNFDGKKVVKLEYEAYESMATKEIQKICALIRDKWPRVHKIALHHRLGEVEVKEASVVIGVSSPHRQDALEAVEFAINKLKETVPIWKKEVYEEGPSEWKQNKEWNSGKSIGGS